jgi:transcriptional regulator with XRE-family HTH domain
MKRKVDLNLIKNLRIQKKISMQSMAESLGFKNGSTYMKYEKGDYSFKANHLPIVAYRLDVEIDDLYFFENEIAKIEISKCQEVI